MYRLNLFAILYYSLVFILFKLVRIENKTEYPYDIIHILSYYYYVIFYFIFYLIIIY